MTLLEAQDENAALERLHELGCTDGLPVVVPTPKRVERFVLETLLDPDLSLGSMGPLGGNVSIELMAACAVMAGCRPDYMPVVLAAVKAVLDPTFDATEMQATTHCTAPLVIVNGPVRNHVGMACGFGALGPGHRANASIGRALRLTMINAGGVKPGTSDMALLGHPGKFTYCFGEDEENSPFEPLHVQRGFDREQSVVTVVGAEAPHSVLSIIDGDDPRGATLLLKQLARCLANVGSNNANFRGGQAVVVVNPEHASVLKKAGYTAASIRSAIVEHARNPLSVLREINSAIPAPTRTSADTSNDPLIAAFRSPDDILLVHAGGGGLYSMVMPSWAAGPHFNRAVSVVVNTDEACAVPGATNRA
jgi:hypothetical protein